MKLSDQATDLLKAIDHALSAVGVPLLVLFTWLASALPPLAALASILWIAYQWYHSEPMEKRRAAARAKKENP